MTYPTIQQGLEAVRTAIQQHEKTYGRTPGTTQLLAVSKTKPIAAIREAIEAGQRKFGENYVDEGVGKIQEIGRHVPDGSGLEWHFIGAIQSRKARDIALHFDWAHGVDRLKVAERLSRTRIEANLAPLNICLQVNLDDEPGKAGVPVAELPELANVIAPLPGLHLRGLMAIPAPRKELVEQRAVFARLARLREALAEAHPDLGASGVDSLSCGMSADLEAAVAEGATIVRIGTAIFGAREPRTPVVTTSVKVKSS